jgi:hypothetical protein
LIPVSAALSGTGGGKTGNVAGMRVLRDAAADFAQYVRLIQDADIPVVNCVAGSVAREDGV